MHLCVKLNYNLANSKINLDHYHAISFKKSHSHLFKVRFNIFDYCVNVLLKDYISKVDVK